MTAEGKRLYVGDRGGPAVVLPRRRWWGPPPANDNRPPTPSPLARTLTLFLLAVAVLAAIVWA